MEDMTWKDKIKKAVGDDKYAKVNLFTEDSTSVYHYTGDGESSALSELGSYQTLAELISMPPFTSRGACNIMDTLRDESLMGGYYRGNGEFSEHLAGVLAEDWLCSENGWVEVDLDHMDHKRAMATVTCRVETDVDTILKAGDNQLAGWTASVDTDLGQLNIEC
tara:strand:- start:924 stop:1415 length:492 start_codon:yes stop_codon:yes gene_type:complete